MTHSRSHRPLPEGSCLAFDPPGGRVKTLRIDACGRRIDTILGAARQLPAGFVDQPPGASPRFPCSKRGLAPGG